MKQINEEAKHSERSRNETFVLPDASSVNRHGERDREENYVPSDSGRENRHNERIRNEQFVHSDTSRDDLRSGRNRDEHVVPSNINKGKQHSGRNGDDRLKDSILDSSIPPGFRASDALLLPREPLRTPATWHVQTKPSEAGLLAKEGFRLQNFRKNVEERNVATPAARGSRGLASNGSGDVRSDQQGRCQPDHQYEEIPDLSTPDLSTPKSRLRVPLPPVSAKTTPPSSVGLHCAREMPPPGSFQFPPPAPSHFNFLSASAPPYVSTVQESVHDERSPVVDVSTRILESSWEDEEEDEEEEEPVDWSKGFLGPRFPSLARERGRNSYATEQLELKSLIDRELVQVHRLEQQINKSSFLEHIYVDQPCTLLSQPDIACATTNPDLLSADPRETLEIMKKVYETIANAKMDRRKVLKRLEDVENGQRKSKRLLQKPRKHYNDF